MVEKIGHVKNPLTVIAIFAGIAEISGTIVLPLLTQNAQNIFVWYLMLFPCALVAAFFLTLNFNNTVLYAPSDWKNEENFFAKFSIAPIPEKYTVVEKNESLEQTDSLEVAPDESTESGVNESTEAVVAQEIQEPERKAPGAKVESEMLKHLNSKLHKLSLKRPDISAIGIQARAIGKLSEITGINFQRNYAYTDNGRLIIFDGGAIEKDKISIATIINVLSRSQLLRRLDRAIKEFESVANSGASAGVKSELHLVFVYDGEKIAGEAIFDEAERSGLISKYFANIKFFSLKELGVR